MPSATKPPICFSLLTLLLASTLTSSSSTDPPIPAPWPPQFHSILFMNRSGSLQKVDLWYDWPNGRNFNIIQHQLGKLTYDLEWDNGTSYIYTLDSNKECRVLHFQVGILRPNWLDGANYLGQRYMDGFLCNVWEKVEFIWYYEDVVTRRPVYWAFYTGAIAHVMTFEVGRVLEDPNWQAPVYCFKDAKEEKSSQLAQSVAGAGPNENVDHHLEIDSPMALRDLEERVNKLQATIEQQNLRMNKLEKGIMDHPAEHQNPHPSPTNHQSACPNPTYPQSPYPSSTIHQSPYPCPIPMNQRVIPSSHLNPKANSSSKSNLKLSRAGRSRIFTNLSMTLSMALGHLIKSGHLNPLDPRPPSNPLPRKYDMSLYCAYHQTQGHNTDSCSRLRHEIQDLIDQKIITPLPNPPSDLWHNDLDLQALHSPTSQSQPSLKTLKGFATSMSAQQPTGPGPINKCGKGIDNTWYESDEYCPAKNWTMDVDDISAHMLLGEGGPGGSNDDSEVIVFGTAAAKANVDALGNLTN